MTTTTQRTLDIGIDLDGVCYDFVEALRHWVSTSTGRCRTTMPDAQGWDFHRDQWGMSLEEFLGHYSAGVDAGVIFTYGEPLPGTKEAFAALRAAGHRLHVVTDRARVGSPGVSEKATRAWLDAHGLTPDTLTLASAKESILAQVPGLVCFLEDRRENAEALTAAGVPVVLLDQPWNRGAEIPGVTRVKSWDEALELISRLER